MKSLAFFLLVLLATGSLQAAETPIVTVLGPTEFDVSSIDPTKAVEILPPVLLRLEGDLKPEINNATSMKVKVLSVSVGTAARPEYGNGFEFGSFAAGKKGELRELKVIVHLSEIPEPQTYIVKILVLRDGDPTVPAQTFDLKFTRPAATLSLTPSRIDNVLWAPLSGSYEFLPNQLKLQETSGRASLTGVQIRTKDLLKGPNDVPVSGEIRVSTIDKIEAGKDSTPSLEVVGGLPLGSAKGTLVVRSRQLAQPVEVSIEILTRTTRVWLILALAISIALGYFFRTSLDKQRAENQGRLNAEQQYQQIDESKEKAIDSDIQNGLETILTTLRAVIEATPFNAVNLDAATKKAGSEVDAVIKKADEDRNALRLKLKALREKLGLPIGQPKVLSQFVETRILRMQELERDLNRGAVGTVTSALDALDQEVTNGLPELIQKWAEGIHETVNKFGQWTGLDFEAVRRQFLEDTNAANAQKLDLTKTRELARTGRISLVLAGLHQVGALSTQIVDRLDTLKLNELEPLLLECRARILDAQKLQEADQPATVTGISSLHALLTEAIVKAAALTNVAKPEGLDEGDFSKAIGKLFDSLPKETKEKPFGVGPQKPATNAATAVANVTSLLASAVPPSRDSWWDIQLDVPLSPAAGDKVTAKVTVVGGGTIGNFVWQIGDEATPSPGGAERIFTPAHPGVLAISVRAVDFVTGEVRNASINIRVRAKHGSQSIALLIARLAKHDRLQTIVSGVFITLAGYAIFRGSWYGTFTDFMAAGLWGFSVDFSVTKVREMATPLLTRTIPFSGSK